MYEIKKIGARWAVYRVNIHYPESIMPVAYYDSAERAAIECEKLNGRKHK